MAGKKTNQIHNSWKRKMMQWEKAIDRWMEHHINKYRKLEINMKNEFIRNQ